MTCALCNNPIGPDDVCHAHHPIPRCEASDRVANAKAAAPVHAICHLEYHTANGDFARWGRIGGKRSAIDGHWSHHLRNVRDHPAYDMVRTTHEYLYGGGGKRRR